MPTIGFMESRYVDTAGLRMHYLHAGESGAPPVVLLHGFPQTSHMWRHQIPVLAERYEVFAPDTRGFGRTDKPRMRVTRDMLARDIVDFFDALGLHSVRLVGHDWGGIIATKVALDHGARLDRLALVDTLTSVWIPWGIHGYWFKCEPEAEQFFTHHGTEFIRSLFAGAPRSYSGPPHSPWAPVDGAAGSEAMSDWDPTRVYTADDAEHFALAFDDPDVWFHAIEYYRHALPFHLEHDDTSARHGKRYEFWSNPKVAAMWSHEGLLFSHPDYGPFPVFAPEDRHKTFDGPTLYLFSPFLMPQAFVDGALPPDDYVPAGNLYAESFPRHFPDLVARGAQCGHFIPEEAPERTNAVLAAFLA